MSTDYPSDWDSRRKDVYQRDDHQCQNCGRNGGTHGGAELHAHHIVPKSKGGTHQRSNLITVCRDCHNAIHGDNTAPTSGRPPQEDELSFAVVEKMESISQNDAASNQAIDRLAELFSKAGEGEEFLIEEYEAIRYEIIKHAFKTKKAIDAYQSQVRPYLNNDAQTDLDSYVDATWESIQAKVFVTGHADEILLEFANRDIVCNECGEIIEPNAKFCKHCGDEVELIPECESCGSELDTKSNFCSECGTEVTRDIQTDNQIPVDGDAVEKHAEEMSREIEDAIDKTLLVQLLEQKFQLVWMEDYEPVWEYCPNCGLERGALSKHRNAECLLCDAKWTKKGILNTYWKGTKIPDADLSGVEDHSKVRWENRGKKKYKEEVYLTYLDELSADIGPE